VLATSLIVLPQQQKRERRAALFGPATMTEVTENIDTVDSSSKKNKNKKETTPPEGYVCNLCGAAGHWIQQCSQRDKINKKKRKPSGQSQQHEYRPGVDPSPKDIEDAQKMQALEPPMCDCGIPSRVKKVKRSKKTENSRAVGAYFFFCTKKKDDATKCNFAQPVEELHKTDKDKKQANFFAKKRKGL